MVVPAPRQRRAIGESFVLGPETVITVTPETTSVGSLLREQLAAGTGLPLPLSADGGSAIDLRLDPTLAAEAYRMRVDRTGIAITGGAAAGIFHATQTLRQLLPPSSLRRAPVAAGRAWSVPGVEIADAPAFAWRGLMLDVSRRFLPPRDVLRIIDLLAFHHLNVLHLHLTDDQGWRIRVPGFPRLTEVGSWRTGSQIGADPDAPDDGRPHGGFYEDDDLREIVAYAAARSITVVPEIEAPGHARAALAAYPELGVTGRAQPVWTRWGVSDDVFNAEEATIDFFRRVLDHVTEIFPSTFIGIGGDECPKIQWRQDPRTQQRMRELGLADEDRLQAWFVGRLAQHLQGLGRRAVGWDEILEGGTVPSSAAVLSWRGMTGAVTAARRGHDVVSCPDDQVYLDYRQSDSPDEPIPVSIPLGWEDVYAFDPVPDGLSAVEQLRILGGQANLWTEHIDTPQRVDYMLFPRLGALAEALWLGRTKDLASFASGMPDWLDRLDALGVDYRPPGGPHPWQTVPGVAGRPATREERAAHVAELTSSLSPHRSPD